MKKIKLQGEYTSTPPPRVCGEEHRIQKSLFHFSLITICQTFMNHLRRYCKQLIE